MKLAHLTLVLAITAAGCATETAVAPGSASPAVAHFAANSLTIPPLYIVDGVRLKMDQIPKLDPNDVLSVSVMKGHLALQKYGPEAAYGVVIVTTKAGNFPQT